MNDFQVVVYDFSGWLMRYPAPQTAGQLLADLRELELIPADGGGDVQRVCRLPGRFEQWVQYPNDGVVKPGRIAIQETAFAKREGQPDLSWYWHPPRPAVAAAV